MADRYEVVTFDVKGSELDAFIKAFDNGDIIQYSGKSYRVIAWNAETNFFSESRMRFKVTLREFVAEVAA